jgi:leucine dehydrogenase
LTIEGAALRGVFDRLAGDGYEQVVFCHDEPSGLRAIIAIHSTALGPGLGGTRFYPYESEELALVDVLRLSRAMTYKAAAAGLDLGGAKAAIIGDPERDKSEELLRAYGRFVESLGGRYITAEDVGTRTRDMDIIRRETRWVTGVSPALGGYGEISPATAYALLHGLRAITLELWGSPELTGRRFAVQGVGKVGYQIARRLVEEGGEVIVADVDPQRVAAAVHDLGVRAVAADSIHRQPCDVFVPCALGGILNDETIPQLQCSAVGGAANNQLLMPHHAKLLHQVNVLYAPDFVINAGGLIYVAQEVRGLTREAALVQVKIVFQTLRRVFRLAREDNITTAEAADRVAEERIRRVGRSRKLWLSGTRG